MLKAVPKIIWQTAPSVDAIPEAGLECMKSWASHNPAWSMRMADDQEIREFFRVEMPQYLEIFDLLPLGVMKADLWRYAVIFRHGGVYADLDTICTQPLETWLSAKGDHRLHVAMESAHPFFCQWVFAAPARHPVLLETLDLIASRIRADGGVDPLRKDYVHYYTGPAVWTDAIREFIRRESDPARKHVTEEMWRKECLVTYSPGYFTWGTVQHQFASFNWHDPEYPSWQVARQIVIGKALSVLSGNSAPGYKLPAPAKRDKPEDTTCSIRHNAES